MTSTTTTFQTMLNDYLTNDLLKEELVRRDYLLSNIERLDDWKGGTLVVPFKAAGASSVAFGSLTGSTDIAEDKYVRGTISGPKEVWGTMQFNHRDLMEHNEVSEQNFLKLLPDTLDDFMDNLKNVVSTNLLNGAWIATLTSDGGASGTLIVDHPERFSIGQKLSVDDSDVSATTGYVRSIDMNTKTLTCYDARSGGSLVNFSAYTTAKSSKIYNDGAEANSFSSLRGALLSSANGGDTNIAGVAKTLYPYLQAINVDGSDINKTNILERIFSKYVTVRTIGRGAPTDVVMSWTNLGYCMAAVEAQKGAFNVTPGSQKASEFGWMEISIGSVTKGMLKLVGIQECDNDVIMFIDWRALSFHSNGFFQKRKSPFGNEYFEVRNTTGYVYIVDVCLFGELCVKRPSYCGIIYGISIT